MFILHNIHCYFLFIQINKYVNTVKQIGNAVKRIEPFFSALPAKLGISTPIVLKTVRIR